MNVRLINLGRPDPAALITIGAVLMDVIREIEAEKTESEQAAANGVPIEGRRGS